MGMKRKLGRYTSGFTRDNGYYYKRKIYERNKRQKQNDSPLRINSSEQSQNIIEIKICVEKDNINT